MGMVIVISVVAFIFYKLVVQRIYPSGNKDNEATAQGCGIVLAIIVIGIAIAILS